jgi:hypothetical protein
MSQKLYLIVSGIVFLLVGIFHVLRLLYHWQVFVGPSEVPYSLSYVGCPVSLGYSVWACWLLVRTYRADLGARGEPRGGGDR